jgi:hypothetical protein
VNTGKVGFGWSGMVQCGHEILLQLSNEDDSGSHQVGMLSGAGVSQARLQKAVGWARRGSRLGLVWTYAHEARKV